MQDMGRGNSKRTEANGSADQQLHRRMSISEEGASCNNSKSKNTFMVQSTTGFCQDQL
jgi:uncharacterized protein YqkB